MSYESYFTYVLACMVVVIVPGPSVTVIIANSVKYGTRAGVLNVLGTQAGLALMLGVLVLGLSSVIEFMGWAFEWLKLLGAAYLVWLGYKLIRTGGKFSDDGNSDLKKQNFFWQGFWVVWANPKALFFFGAFIPQFITVDTVSVSLQTALLGGVFMFVALVLDGGYAVLAGQGGRVLNQTNVNVVQKVSGTCLIVGGIWLAFTKRA